jgi:predicted Fe-Mo cluster-binding NifX family protein
MKIAVVTDDGKTVSKHFGRATHYLVATVEDGQIVAREMRPKVGHGQFSGEAHDAESHGQHHGTGPHAQSRHAQMAEAIADCESLICGGMGYGAYESMRQRGIRPIISDELDVDQAVTACAEGRLVDHAERLH